MKKLLILLALASPLAAELPPLSQEARQQQSQLIVVGKVASLKLLRVPLDLGSDSHLLNPNGWEKP